jgi:hypothetical protein
MIPSGGQTEYAGHKRMLADEGAFNRMRNPALNKAELSGYGPGLAPYASRAWLPRAAAQPKGGGATS